MEVAADASAVAKNGVVLMPSMSSSSFSQSPRKEWRAVSEQSVRNSGNEELERSKLGHSDERLIYEQKLHAVAKQREELQHLEIELRAQVIIAGMQNTFDAQIQEHANVNIKLQEQMHEKEQKILELDRRMSEKERELHAVRLDNETAWAKEDIIREQSKELQSYRRDRDNSEAEKAQHIKQIHDLQEHIQEKESQFMELQEQHRIIQETMNFKDEQIRDAQAWMTRAQEMDAFQATTSHTLQAELRERTELYNQLWLGCQGQFAEMERLHLYIQQLQLELADLKEKSGRYLNGSDVTHINSNDVTQLEQANGSQLEVKGNSLPGANSDSLPNGNSEIASPFTFGENVSTEINHVGSVAFAPTSPLGMPTYLPTAQVTALHPFMVHQQGMVHPSHVTQSHVQSVPAMSSIQNWQDQQALQDGHQPQAHNQYSQQTEHNLLGTDSHYDHGASVNGQVLHENYLDININRGLDADAVVPPQNPELLDSGDKIFGNVQSQQNFQQISAQFLDALRLDPLQHGNVIQLQEKKVNPVSDQGPENRSRKMESPIYSANSSSSEASTLAANEITMNTGLAAVSTNAFVSTELKSNIVGKSGENYLLDEKALLACIARTIGSGGKIHISSTLPNRLGRMLAPLHWHDYKKKFGKLDDFVASHPELFLIEGDYIQLREGAQETIAAKAAAAKVAAAAAAPSSHSSLLPSVAVTPMARSHRHVSGRIGPVAKQQSRTIPPAANPRR